MTPMIDVVFLLLIFFLVSSQLAQRESRVKVNLPSARSGTTDGGRSPTRMTLTLQGDGRLWLAGERVSRSGLTARLQAERQRQDAPPSLTIRCDRAVSYGDVEPLLGSALRAGLSDVSFAVLEPERR